MAGLLNPKICKLIVTPSTSKYFEALQVLQADLFIDKTWLIEEESKEDDMVCVSKNYELIPKLPKQILNITKEKVIKDKAGKYPLIHINFQSGKLRSFKDVFLRCRKIVHEFCKEHSYIPKSRKLDVND